MAELQVAGDTIEKSLEHGNWFPFDELPREAWTAHAALLAEQLPALAVEKTARAYASLSRIQLALGEVIVGTRRRSRLQGIHWQNPLRFDQIPLLRDRLQDVLDAVREAERLLAPLSHLAPDQQVGGPARPALEL